jgi:putative phosphoribosyl transferase
MKTRTQPFEDRQEAALCLAETLSDLARSPWPVRESDPANGGRPHTLLLGLTRGGVPLAYTLARHLNLPFDILVVRKLPAPGNPELALGAISEHGAEVLNEDILRWIVDAEETLASVCAREEKELERRVRLYRGGRKNHPIAGNHVVLVDDGAATGATMRAAIAAARKAGAVRVTVALPVAPKETCEELAAEADEVRCLWQPDWFQSVGAYYRHFPQVSDAQVQEALGVPRDRPLPAQTAGSAAGIPASQAQRPLPF